MIDVVIDGNLRTSKLSNVSSRHHCSEVNLTGASEPILLYIITMPMKSNFSHVAPTVYKKAETLSREYSSTKGPGTTARPWEHPFFLKLGPIIRKRLEKANHENGFM